MIGQQEMAQKVGRITDLTCFAYVIGGGVSGEALPDGPNGGASPTSASGVRPIVAVSR
ncbi:hypothetical protein ACWC09_16845 [Streptomyces sp. NPDC001617]